MGIACDAGCPKHGARLVTHWPHRLVAEGSAADSTLSMRKSSGRLLALLFFLIPLTYSFDGDPYRAWEVMFWGGVTCVIALTYRVHLRAEPELFLVTAYAALLVLQQLLIADGHLWFGAQYAIVFFLAVLPSLVMRWLCWSDRNLHYHWDSAIRWLTLIIVLNITGAKLLSWGELHIGGVSGERFFGYLGDSISPVIVFPLLYFYFERRYIWMSLMIGALILTGGKAAIIMLLSAPLLILLVRMRTPIRLFVICVVPVAAFAVESMLTDLIRRVLDDPSVSYSLNTRLLSIDVGWEYFERSPVWGIGINQSMRDIQWDAQELARYYGITEYHPVYQVDNAFVRALAETGVIGLCILLGFCGFLLRRAFSALRYASASAPSRLRSMVQAGGLWTMLFIVVYQSTGWFEHGHPQFAWLLLFGSITSVAARQLVQIGRVQISAGFRDQLSRHQPFRTSTLMKHHPTWRKPSG